MSEEEDEPGGPEWQAVRKVVAPLSRMHTLFSSTVRFLAHQKREASDFVTSFPLMTILRSPKMQAVVYYAAQELGHGTADQIQQLSAQELLSRFHPEELAAVTVIPHLAYRIRQLCPEEVWQPIRRDLVLQIEVGRIFGDEMPYVGKGKGLVVGGLRPLSAALFSQGNAHAYIRYAGHLNRTEQLYDLEYEREHWGCTHLQVFGWMLQQIGFGVHAARAVSLGLESRSSSFDIEGDAGQWLAAGLWIQSLLEKEDAPGWLPSGTPMLQPKKVENILRQMTYLESNPPEVSWYERKKEELPHKVSEAFHALGWPSKSRSK